MDSYEIFGKVFSDVSGIKLKDTNGNIHTFAEGGGGGGTKEGTVRFLDYDGTVVTAYTPTEFAKLTELPANPAHEGLTAQGWNWTLENAKAYVEKYGALDIGQMYITDDGKTRIHIRLEQGRTSPVLGIGLDGTAVVDWGDGTDAETLTSDDITSATFTEPHNYASPGEYTISLAVNGSMSFIFRTDSGTSSLLSYSANNDSRNRTYLNAIKAINIGDSVTSIGNYAFGGCSALSSVTIPDSVTSIGGGAFGRCSALSSVTIPDSVTSIGESAFGVCSVLSSVTIPGSVTSIGESAFNYCSALSSVTIPGSVTSIGGYAFSDCPALSSVTIPDSVTSIGDYAFGGCPGVAEYHILPSSPPVFSGMNVFNTISPDCVIYVPVGSLETYQNNRWWSSYSSYIREEGAVRR